MASSLPPVQFSASRRAQLDSQCDDLLDRALRTHDKFHAASTLGGWQRVRRRNAMNVYRSRSLDDVEGPRVLLGSGIVPGTLEDALNGVYCDSTESLRVCKSLLSDKFVDGAVLRVFEANNLRAPIVFAGIKWFIMRGFAGTSGLLGDKDMLTYERMGRIKDRGGQYFAYHVLQSIDLPERPANRERGLQRVEVSWCYLYRQLSPDWLGVFLLGDLNMSTMVPPSITSFVCAERQETPPELDNRYDYSSSPTAEHVYNEENVYFEEESVESGPWTECLPNECSGNWTVVFDEDRQEYVRIRVPGMETEALGSSRVKTKPQVVCIDELD
ncbi:hypothetical protein PHMEG_0009175 [Phytophthora megakarya]|uniref:Uncharacterized protein n=1 Tax=Phytophthora megakarya TaxID=4795 RepID=A0A225WIW6_9STRA|nr:hypothetical protein PHMEG_0009175 [Phytophthora megakarya]